ncbi:MAG TPA: leucine-rich repeat protein, partial [Candidatus Acidoferrales bacterium]|nr:leucine-rich repeat protein [Candidatus Acidoferrales bacterium]
GMTFAGCAGLTNATIGSSVTIIGDYAFSSCQALQSVDFGGNAPVPTDDTSVFQGDVSATVHYQMGTTGWGPTFDGLPTVAH